MARLKNGFMGGFTGKLGTAVGYYLYNEPHVRALPRTKRYTAAEQVNHQKFKLVQDYILPIKDIVKVGFKDYYTKTGGYRAAVAYTRKVALQSDDTGFYIDPALLKISGGDLPAAIHPFVTIDQPLQLKIDWDVTTDQAEFAHDQLMLLIYEMTEFKSLQFIMEGPFRKDGTFSVALPDHFAGKAVDVYIGFIAKDRSRQSDSQYLGRLEV